MSNWLVITYWEEHLHLLIQWCSSYPSIILSRQAAYSVEEVLVSLWIRELYSINNNNVKKRMIKATTCYGEWKDVRAKSTQLMIEKDE